MCLCDIEKLKGKIQDTPKLLKLNWDIQLTRVRRSEISFHLLLQVSQQYDYITLHSIRQNKKNR